MLESFDVLVLDPDELDEAVVIVDFDGVEVAVEGVVFLKGWWMERLPAVLSFQISSWSSLRFFHSKRNWHSLCSWIWERLMDSF